MKILYGVQGTGNGHITRARVMAKKLAEANDPSMEITFLFSGRDQEQFFEMECFGNCLYRKGLTFVTEKGKINHLKTVFFNNPIGFIQEVRNLNVEPYDLIITDFEPVSAWAGKMSGKTVIGLGHQYAFGHNIPLAGYTIIASLIMKYFAPANIRMGLHWNHFGHTILPPIIDNGHLRSECNDTILVYLPFEDQDLVTRMLNGLTEHEFVQYSSDIEDGQSGNVARRKASHTGFKRDLAAAKAVVCNAGFELVSECLNMGIATLVKPVKGQFEQESNAAALLQLGYSSAMYSLDSKVIGDWINQARPAPEITFNDTAGAVVDWLLKTSPEEFEKGSALLTKQLWADDNLS